MNSKYKFAVVVVLYNPNEDAILNLDQFDEFGLYIVNNGQNSISDKLMWLTEKRKFNYFDNKNKGGIAGALNIGVTQAFADGYDYVFTFDQDSQINNEFIPSMEVFIKNKNADIVCPNFYDVNSHTFATFVELTKFRYKVVVDADVTAFAISSGMGLSKNAWQQIGLFDERYFIDHVDTDFCLRAAVSGLTIHVNRDVCLEHAIGNRTCHRFLGVTLKPNHHNYIRKYYIVRNGTHLGFKYFFKFPSYFYLNILRVSHEFACVLLYENDKRKKVLSMIKGLWHSVTNHLGQYE